MKKSFLHGVAGVLYRILFYLLIAIVMSVLVSLFFILLYIIANRHQFSYNEWTDPFLFGASIFFVFLSTWSLLSLFVYDGFLIFFIKGQPGLF
ncbi:MAG TPA: hypothetical protein VG842_10990, partial [Sediminibacterium sp.]|nr:hypothetical protein [Sediminibacterium sp.]